MLIAHLAIVFVAKWLLPGLDLFFLLVGTTASSYDAILPMLGIRPDSYHTGGIYHSVWVPILGAGVLYALSPVFSVSFLLGGLLHLISDSIDAGGRPWLYPLSKKRFGVALIPYNFKEYISNPACMALESISAAFILYYLIVVGLDWRSMLWILFLTPFFVAFAIHSQRAGGAHK
ncbi:MAG: metal-dependent hydrolase [archaeon]